MKLRLKRKICKRVCTGKPSRYIGNLLKKRYAISEFKWINRRFAFVMVYMADTKSWYKLTKILDKQDDKIIYLPIDKEGSFRVPPVGNWNGKDVSRYQIIK